MSDQPNIIIAGASARAAAFSALRAGLRPYAIDLFADSDLVDVCPAVRIIRYPNDFEQALAAAPQAPWIYTGGLENYPDLVERMSALRPLSGNGPDVLGRVRTPELLANCLTGSTFEMPEIRDSPPPKGSAKEWLRKPRRSSGGLGIRRLAAAVTQTDAKKYYYQKHIPGISHSAVYVARRNDCELLGVTVQQSGVPELPEEPFLYAGSAVTPASFEAGDRLQELGNRLTRDFGLGGLFNVDYVDDGRKIWLLEVNPRYSASMEVLEHAQGKNFLAMHLAQFDSEFRGETQCGLSRVPASVAKRVVYALRDCTVTPELNRLRKEWNVERLLPCLADIPRPGDHILRGQPVATVIVEGASEEEVQRVLNERINAVRQSLSPF